MPPDFEMIPLLSSVTSVTTSDLPRLRRSLAPDLRNVVVLSSLKEAVPEGKRSIELRRALRKLRTEVRKGNCPNETIALFKKERTRSAGSAGRPSKHSVPAVWLSRLPKDRPNSTGSTWQESGRSGAHRGHRASQSFSLSI